MAKAAKKSKTTNEKPTKVDGTFLEVFKVVKKNKEQKAKKSDLETKVDEINAKKKP